VATRPDPVPVGRHDDEHLRRFIQARSRNDAGAMRRWWDELVIDFYDRMDGFVAAAHKGRLDDEEHELAVQMAMIRFSQNLISTFDGISMGQLVNATKTLARGICMDVQRLSMTHRGRTAVSIDDGWDLDGTVGPTGPSWEAGEAWRRFEADARSRDVEDFLDWALPQVAESRRRVLEMTFEGAELSEICAELEIEEANAYQRRSRGLRDLSKLKELYDA
jgi:hypothetical protein